MRPVLVQIGGFPVPAYGAALALAFTVGILVAFSRARRSGLDPLTILDVSLVIIVTSLLGSRLLHLATVGDWREILAYRQSDGSLGVSGLSMLGGVVLALLATATFLRARGLPVLPYCDVIAPSVALGEAITRLGCLANGCCFGTLCTLPWGIRFPADSFAAAALGEGALLHPAQLYTSAFFLTLFVGLCRLALRRPPPGVVLWAFLAGHGAGRFVLELVRYHEEAEIALRLWGRAFTTHQAIALGLLGLGLAGLAHATRRGALSGATETLSILPPPTSRGAQS